MLVSKISFYSLHLPFLGRILADFECWICNKRKTSKTGSSYEGLQKCETETAAKRLQSTALEKADNLELVAEMALIGKL